MNLFSIEEAGDKGASRPFPLHPKSPPHRLRFAPTAVHLRSGTPFGFPPESMFTFTGIPSLQTFHAGMLEQE